MSWVDGLWRDDEPTLPSKRHPWEPDPELEAILARCRGECPKARRRGRRALRWGLGILLAAIGLVGAVWFEDCEDNASRALAEPPGGR